MKEIRSFASPRNIIRRKLMKHEQNYLLQVHLYKLKSIESLPMFNKLSYYLYSLLNGEFQINHTIYKLRGSQLKFGLNMPKTSTKNTYACKVADIALKAIKSNHQRHSLIQKFLLATDRTTIAVEIPVFLTSKETNIIFGKRGGLLGHIDFLQIHKDRVFILDYKPEAAKEKHVHEQLLIYSLAISQRTNIHLKNITCGWFDDKSFYSFAAMDVYSAFKKFKTNLNK